MPIDGHWIGEAMERIASAFDFSSIACFVDPRRVRHVDWSTTSPPTLAESERPAQ